MTDSRGRTVIAPLIGQIVHTAGAAGCVPVMVGSFIKPTRIAVRDLRPVDPGAELPRECLIFDYDQDGRTPGTWHYPCVACK